MGRIEDYISKQRRIINLAEKRKATAEIIAQKTEGSSADSHSALRIYNRNRDLTDKFRPTYPVRGEESPDSVYRKLSKAKGYVHHNRCQGERMLADYINQLQIKMEERKMEKGEYFYLKETSVKRLILEFSDMLKV